MELDRKKEDSLKVGINENIESRKEDEDPEKIRGGDEAFPIPINKPLSEPKEGDQPLGMERGTPGVGGETHQPPL